MRLPVPIRRAVERMRAYHPPLEGRAGKLRLDFNENTIGPSPAVRRALARLTPDQVAMYPEYKSTERRLARYFRVRPAELILTNGTDEALRLVVDAFVEGGSRVLLVEPTFAMYRFYAELAGARIMALRYDRAMRFPLDAVVRGLRQRPRLMFLANPNNPTGTLVGKAELRQVLRTARETLVVVDEAYFDFCGVTLLPWIRRYPNLIVTRTFSKAAGLAGLRVGCVFANEGITGVLRKAHSPYPVNTAALVAAVAAARDGRFPARYAREVDRSKRLLEQALLRLGISLFPGAANFVLVDFGRRAPALLRALRRGGILLRDRRGDFGRVGFVRITVGTRAQTERLIREIEALW